MIKDFFTLNADVQHGWLFNIVWRLLFLMEKINTIKMLNLMIGLEKRYNDDDDDGKWES